MYMYIYYNIKSFCLFVVTKLLGKWDILAQTFLYDTAWFVWL